MYYWLFLIPAFFFVLAIIGAVMQDRAEKRKQALKEYLNMQTPLKCKCKLCGMEFEKRPAHMLDMKHYCGDA